MIHDAKVEVSCDGDGCYESIEVDLPYRYSDYSGKNGSYDASASTVNGLVQDEGWRVDTDGDDVRHYCEECQ